MSDPVEDLLDAPDAPSAPPRRKRPWVKFLKLALLLLVVGLVGWAMVKQWRLLAANDVEVHVRILPLIAALASLVAVACVQLLSYRMLLAAYAKAPRWRNMPTIAWVPAMGKYVPAAAPVAATALLNRFGVPLAPAIAVVLTLDGLAVLAGLITGVPLLMWQPIAKNLPFSWLIAVPVIVCGMLCLLPAVFAGLLNFLLRKLKKQPLARTPSLVEFIVPVSCAFAQWLFSGLALLFIVMSVRSDTSAALWSKLPLLICFAALSQTVGYLAVFAPGGFGVREAILLACFTPLPGVGPLAAVIVPIRAIMQIVLELSLASVGLILARLVPSSGVAVEGLKGTQMNADERR